MVGGGGTPAWVPVWGGEPGSPRWVPLCARIFFRRFFSAIFFQGSSMSRPRRRPGTACKNGHIAPLDKRGGCSQCTRNRKAKKAKLGPKWLRDAGHPWIRSARKGLRKLKVSGERIASNQELLALWLKQNNRCALTGLPIVGRADLDHKTPAGKGGTHTIENLQWADRRANAAKGDGSDFDLQEWVLAAAKSIVRVRRLEKALRDARQQGLFP